MLDDQTYFKPDYVQCRCMVRETQERICSNPANGEDALCQSCRNDGHGEDHPVFAVMPYFRRVH